MLSMDHSIDGQTFLKVVQKLKGKIVFGHKFLF